MFTIRHDCGGNTYFHEATRVTRVGPHAQFGPEGLYIDIGAEIDQPNTVLQGGVAYVMNEAGQTVARFDLPNTDVPKEGGSIE